MKKLISSVILIISVNLSYASFPITDTLKVNQDILETEEIKQYHSSLVKMGIDLNDCRCESCRKSNNPFKKNTMQKSAATGLYILSAVILLGVIIYSSIGLTRAYNCVDTGDDCPQSAGQQTKKGMPIELLSVSLLILISAGVALKARFIQLRNKRSLQSNSRQNINQIL